MTSSKGMVSSMLKNGGCNLVGFEKISYERRDAGGANMDAECGTIAGSKIVLRRANCRTQKY